MYVINTNILTKNVPNFIPIKDSPREERGQRKGWTKTTLSSETSERRNYEILNLQT